MRIHLGLTFVFLFTLSLSLWSEENVDNPVDSTNIISLERFRNLMNDLQNAKRLNDNEAILSAYKGLSRFYSLSGIREKAIFYKEAQLDILYHQEPIDSTKIYFAKNDLQGIAYSHDVEIDKGEIYRIMNYAIKTGNDVLKEECHALYRSYIMQNDLFQELHDFYMNDYPEELELIRKNEFDNYLRIKASIFELKGQPDSSLAYLNKAEELVKKNDNKYWVAKFYIRFGQFMERQNNIKEAIKHYLTSLTYSGQVQFMPFMLEATAALEDLYYKDGQYKEAFKYAKQSIELQDKLNGMANRDELLRLEIIKENELNELEIEKKELETQAMLSKEKVTKWISIFSGIVLLLIAIWFWTRMRYVARVNGLLKTAKFKAEQGEKLKQQFLANMSHEIRTPMNAILGMSNLMLETGIDDQQKKYLMAIKSSCENLLVIINDVLDLSKLEAGKMELEKISFSIREQVRIAYETLRFKAEEKGLSCETIVADDIPEKVIGDSNRLNQILINLCGNAIKFTEKGSVTLKVEMEGEGECTVRFTISDTGIGISEEMISNVFSSFQQADLSTSRKYGGTGLGLSISQTLVELQGGRIEVKSEEGKGSVFTFAIPYESCDHVPIEKDESKGGELREQLKGIKILVAEDNEFNQIVINDTLFKLIEDVQVDIAENGQVTIDKLLENDYDLILMDVNMPEMDGHEATREIRKLEGPKKSIPIVALTASVLKTEIQKCFDCGMDAFIAKPFNNDELIEVLAKYYPGSKTS